MSGAIGQPQFRGAHQPRREDELPGLAAAGASPTRWPARWTSTSSTSRWGRTSRASPSTCATSGRAEREVARDVEQAVQSDMFRKSYGEVFDGDERWNSLEVPERRAFRLGRRLHLRAPAALLRGHASRADAGAGYRRRARTGFARRQRHHRPHLTGGVDQARRPGRGLPAGTRRGAARLQLLRLAPRQPRGDDARHVRQHPPAQPAGAARGRVLSRAASLVHLPDGEQMSIYDAADALRAGERAARGPGRQGVRLGLLARLGGEGHAPAWRARGDRARASSASTAPTWSAWGCCRCSSPTARARSRSG